MRKDINIYMCVAVILAIIGSVSCSNSVIVEDRSRPIIFANNRVLETSLKSIEQTSTWSEGDAFGVYATEYDLHTFSVLDRNTKVSFSKLSSWTYDNTKYWPTESQNYTFFAYFPYASENELEKPIVEDSTGRLKIEYGVNNSVKFQEDLLWDWIIDASRKLPSGESTTEGNGNNTSFSFQHALSRIRFRVQANTTKNIYITSLSLTAYGNGLFSTIRTDGNNEPTTIPTWETKDPLMTFSVVDQFIPSTDNQFGYLVDSELRDLGFIITHRNDNDADYEAFMIPQTKTGIKIRLSYNIVNKFTIGDPEVDKIEKEFTDLDLQEDWLLGLQYVYNININMDESSLTTSVGTWNDFDEIYNN